MIKIISSKMYISTSTRNVLGASLSGSSVHDRVLDDWFGRNIGNSISFGLFLVHILLSWRHFYAKCKSFGWGKTWRDWTCLQPLNFSTSQPQPLSCLTVALCVFVAGIFKCGEKSKTYLNQIPVEVLYCTVYIVPVQVTSKPMLVLFHPAWEKSVFAMLQIFLCKVLYVKRLTVLKIKIFTNYVITIFQKK